MPLSRDNESKDSVVIGLDEAGRGPWAGPLVVAACYIPPHVNIEGIMDSKKIKEFSKREIIYQQIVKECVYVYYIISPRIVERKNILNATLDGFTQCINTFPKVKNLNLTHAFIDGNRLPKTTTNVPCTAVVKGDDTYMNIAAASIIAKQMRDKEMIKLSKIYPQYGWETNAGYGVPQHIEAIKRYGITPEHRKTYAPVKKFIVTGDLDYKKRKESSEVGHSKSTKKQKVEEDDEVQKNEEELNKYNNEETVKNKELDKVINKDVLSRLNKNNQPKKSKSKKNFIDLLG
jgi:ribonuclease HII